MRDDYAEFRRRGAEVVGIAPHDVAEAHRLVQDLKIPFPILADDNRAVFLAYDVQSRPWSLGQRPAVYVVDRAGVIRWAYLGWQQWDIPTNAQVLAVLDDLAAEYPVEGSGDAADDRHIHDASEAHGPETTR